ncbi:MAG: glycosyltransferase family 1 protein [Planctomycetota bacterium]|nr:MAG: glycosyltransferase family 1 protein [Planctomycetota bacterium]
MVDCYVCVSDSVQRFSVSSGKLPAGKIHVIPNGVDPSEFASGTSPEPPLPVGRGRFVVYVGRLDAQKGVDVLLHSAAEWLPRYPDVYVLLAGDGPQRTRLQRLAHTLGIDSRVLFLGFRKDIPALLHASELFVLPSRWEGMPNAVLEAMAAGLPVVATDVEGVREVLGDTAPLVPPDNPRELTTQITRILDSPSLAQSIGEANRERAFSLFSWDSVADRYQALWARLLDDEIPQKTRKMS